MSDSMDTEYPVHDGTGDLVELQFDYTPRRAGVYDRLPEDCYPDEEEELEITEITRISDGEIIPVPEDAWEYEILESDIFDYLQKMAEDHY